MADDADAAGSRILVVDDDIDIARYVELNLTLEGFDVYVAHSGTEAVERAQELRPDAVLLDVMMPGLDGYEVCRRLRASARTSHCAVLMLTAKTLSADTVLGLTSGADDYITKPFDPPELVARVRAALRRARQLRDVSPLTGLPGNSEITRQIEALVEDDQPFAVLHADLDSFKAFNDRYGFLRGDEAIRATADVLAKVVEGEGYEQCFLGHVGGDDFVLLAPPERAEDLARDIIEAFDAVALALYDEEDAARGYVEVADRRHNRSTADIMSISIGIASSTTRPLLTVAEASSIASEMKVAAKGIEGSAFRTDQRRS